MRQTLVVGLVAAIMSTSCGVRPNDPVVASSGNLAIALANAIDISVIPRVAAFRAEAETFEQAAQDFCVDLDEPALATLQAQWIVLFEQWYRLAIFNFGPLDDNIIFPQYSFIDSLRVRGTDYLATVRDEISANMASMVTLDEAFFDAQTFDNVGLLALESAVFERASMDHSQLPADIVGEYAGAPRKCEILEGLARQIAKRAQIVEDGWKIEAPFENDPYRTLFLTADLDDETEPLTLLLVTVQEFLDHLHRRHVVTTAAAVSDHAYEAVAETIDEIETLLVGTDETEISFFALMLGAGHDAVVDDLIENIAAARAALVARDAGDVEDALVALDGNFKREVPDSLEVNLGINFSDGD